MADGKIDPDEHASISAGFKDGQAIAAVLTAADALAQALDRATDPEYIGNLAQLYLVRAESLPEQKTA